MHQLEWRSREGGPLFCLELFQQLLAFWKTKNKAPLRYFRAKHCVCSPAVHSDLTFMSKHLTLITCQCRLSAHLRTEARISSHYVSPALYFSFLLLGEGKGELIWTFFTFELFAHLELCMQLCIYFRIVEGVLQNIYYKWVLGVMALRMTSPEAWQRSTTRGNIF